MPWQERHPEDEPPHSLQHKLLLERLSGKESSQDVVKFPVELIIRNSCGDRRMSHKQQNEMLEHLLRLELADLGTCAPEEEKSSAGAGEG